MWGKGCLKSEAAFFYYISYNAAFGAICKIVNYWMGRQNGADCFFYLIYPKENIYATTEDAVTRIVDKVHENNDLPVEGCSNCPLTKFIPQSAS